MNTTDMKRHNLYSYMLLILATLLMQGCLKEQEDLFDKKPTERLEIFLDKFQNVLESSEDGWVMDYYPQPAEGRNSSSLYQGYKGDFEFRLDSIVGNDIVYMHGNRTNNAIVLHRFSGDPVEYLNKAAQNAEDIIVDYFDGNYAQTSIRGEVSPPGVQDRAPGENPE